MNILLKRIVSTKEDTLGKMYIDGKLSSFTLEDEARTVKVFGETRIPAGTYEIKLRKEGGFHQRYLKRYGPDFHKGMLHLQDVPNFKWILIHVGNDDDDTAGCLLVGNTGMVNVDGKSTLRSSRDAYERIYPIIAGALEAGETVKITITDNDD